MGKKGKGQKSKAVAISAKELAMMSSGPMFSAATVPDAVNLDSLLDADKLRESALEEFKSAEMKQQAQKKKENANEFPGLGDEPKPKVKVEQKKQPVEEERKAKEVTQKKDEEPLGDDFEMAESRQ